MGRNLIIALPFFLSGCLASTNLLNDSKINPEDRIIMQRMAEKTSEICKTYTYDQSTGKQLSGYMDFNDLPEIKKFYKSNENWYKAEMTVRGVWDNVYYLKGKEALVCGEKQWQDLSKGRSILFTPAY